MHRKTIKTHPLFLEEFDAAFLPRTRKLRKIFGARRLPLPASPTLAYTLALRMITKQRRMEQGLPTNPLVEVPDYTSLRTVCASLALVIGCPTALVGVMWLLA